MKNRTIHVRAVALSLTVGLSLAALPASAANRGESAPAPAPTVSASEVPSNNAPADSQANALELRRGKIIRNSGIISLSLGVVMVGAGAGLEAKRHGICKTTLSEDHKNACDRSLQANAAVLALGVGWTIAGAVLVGIGQTKIRRARAQQRVAFAPQVGRNFAGFAIAGRF
jgi:hypothetical protein